jgi:poly-gamma-glutamate capsule biosynthesis protein CapA/YwtB (metallophosphatase superfamily)
MKNNPIKLLVFVLITLLIAKENVFCATDKTAVLFAAGDTIIARWMHEEEFDGSVEKMFGRILPHIQNSDVALVNLECVISSRGNIVYKGEDNPFSYRVRPSMIKFLKNAGINIVSQANNHAGDYGPTALIDSYEYLTKADILTLGVGHNLKESREIRYVNIHGIVLALIAFDTQQNTFKAKADLPGTFNVDEFDAFSVVNFLIKEARHQADIVIVSPHWGENWLEKPSEERKKLARSFIDSGADSVLGHSAHVLQGMEIYNGRPILYDMGSFLFDSIRDERMRKSMFFELIFTKDGISEIRAYPIFLNWRSVDLAQGNIQKSVFLEFIHRSKELNKEFVYKKTKDYLVIHTVYKNKNSLRDLFFKKKYAKNQIQLDKKDKIEKYSVKIKPNCLVENESFFPEKDSIEFENGIKLLSSKVPNLVDNHTAFFVELYFQAEKLLNGPPCEVQLSLYSRKGDLVFVDSHEPGDWSYPTPQWKIGEIVKDFFLFRVPLDLTEPVYELYLNIISGPKIGTNQGKKIKVIGDNNEKGVFLGLIGIGERNVNVIIPGLYSYEKNELFL